MLGFSKPTDEQKKQKMFQKHKSQKNKTSRSELKKRMKKKYLLPTQNTKTV